MDPIIATLLQAASLFGGAMMSATAERAVGHAWDTVIAAFKQRLGPTHPAPVLAERLRLAGNVEVEAAPLREQLSAIQLNPDPVLLTAMQPLVSALVQQGLSGPLQVNTVNGAVIVMGNQTNTFSG